MHVANAAANSNTGLIRAAAILVGMAALMFPAWLNGSPYLFHDTNAYYRAGANLSTLFSQPSQPEAANAEGQSAGTDAAEFAHHQITHLSARSPFYGFLLYLLGEAAGLWGIVILQAFAASYVLWRATSALSSPHELPAFFTVLAVATLATSLPWYVSFAMPDVWIGLCLFLFGVLAFTKRSLATGDLIALVLLTFAAAAFHTSNAPVIVATMLATALLVWALKISRENALRASAAVAAGLAIAFVAVWTSHKAAERHYHERLRSPIFLTARLLADGPGKAYLLRACAENETRYALCKFKDRPLNHADGILWSGDPERGVWAIADFKTRLALSDEQYAFALSTLLADPWHVTAAALGNTATQLTKFGLDEFTDNYWKKWAGNTVTRSFEVFDIVPIADSCLANPASCEPPGSIVFFDAFEKLIFVASAVLLLWNLIRSLPGVRMSPTIDGNIAALSLLFLAICLANAFVCGALAGPFERYQARLIWMAPILAAILIFAHREVLAASLARFVRFPKPQS